MLTNSLIFALFFLIFINQGKGEPLISPFNVSIKGVIKIGMKNSDDNCLGFYEIIQQRKEDMNKTSNKNKTRIAET